MTKTKKYREVRRALLGLGCHHRKGKGDHEVWYCPCGQHLAVIPRHRDLSNGVVADIKKKLACLPEGWLS